MSGQSRQLAAIMFTASKPLIKLIELLIGAIEEK
jgi:hypothetical protein